jgi:hypothetical protein
MTHLAIGLQYKSDELMAIIRATQLHTLPLVARKGGLAIPIVFVL